MAVYAAGDARIIFQDGYLLSWVDADFVLLDEVFCSTVYYVGMRYLRSFARTVEAAHDGYSLRAGFC